MRRVPLLVLLAALAGGVSTARADLVTVTFSATVGSGTDSGGSTITSLDGFATGDSITGSFTYDSSASAVEGGPGFALYPLVAASVVDGLTTTTFEDTADSGITTVIGSDNEVNVSAATLLGGFDLNLSYSDPTATALGGSLALPASLSGFPNISGNIADTNFSEGSTLSLDFSVVPEPASILAFATGLLGVALIRRRRA